MINQIDPYAFHRLQIESRDMFLISSRKMHSMHLPISQHILQEQTLEDNLHQDVPKFKCQS